MARASNLRNVLAGSFLSAILCLSLVSLARSAAPDEIGREVAVAQHLRDGEEFGVSLRELLDYGEKLFTASFTIEEGAGRPFTKGTGTPLADRSAPLTFPRNFNRISGPDANSCSGCHNKPFTGGGGDIVTEVFVTAQRFDFATFDHADPKPTRGAVDERALFVTQGEQTGPTAIGNERKTIGMFGSGFLEMLARQMTADLQAIRDKTPPGHSSFLSSKGVSFGPITHNPDGTWDTSEIQGLPASSLASTAKSPPTLLICPFHQAGVVASLREFTNNAFNQHHGMQAEERFGIGVDADGDGVVNELTTADITAVTLYQATLPVPGRVYSADPEIREAESRGERIFQQVGCTTCHIPALPLVKQGWVYSEPSPYNPKGNLRLGAPGYPLSVDLTSDELPPPRLHVENGVVMVPAFTDLKLHDITSGVDDPNGEPLDQNHAPGSAEFFTGNRKFITRKLWGFANSGPYMHHGKFTTIREAILAHAGEALFPRMEFQALSQYDQGCVIEFLKTLQVLPPGTKELEVVESGRAGNW